MWSPKRNRNGARNQFYENMLLVQPGDLVFSFNKTRIPAIGEIRSVARESPKPNEFGSTGANWNPDGWRVDVDYEVLERVIRPKDFIDLLRPTLPIKYSPLQKTGDGLQSVYLAHVPAAMADLLLSKIGDAASAAIVNLSTAFKDDDLIEVVSSRIEAEFSLRNDLLQTEKVALSKSRRGQGLFRDRVLQREPVCRVTGVANPSLLIASHIKPWAHCNTNAERLDGNNGLMLTPTVDHLFDKGFISFEDDGRLLISGQLTDQDMSRLNLGLQLPETAFSVEQECFLSYHRNSIFKG